MSGEESKVSKSVNQSFLQEFGKFKCPECSEFFVNYNENICRKHCLQFFWSKCQNMKNGIFHIFYHRGKQKWRHQISPKYILSHHRQWQFLKKKPKLSNRYFQGSLGPQERLWSRTIILFLNEEIVIRTIKNYHLEGPESRRSASMAFRFACDSQKCEKREKSGNFKISHFLRPDWPFTMSDHLILMY